MDCVSNGPFTVNAGDSITVAFALIGGDNLADLQNSACYAQAKWNNTGPCALSSTMTSTNASCFGQCNGTASVSISGGNAPYTYSWSSGQSTSAISGLCAGNYSVTVTDANNITTTASATITQPALLTLSSSSAQTLCSGNCATLTANASGGNGGNTYLWLPGNMNTASVNVCPTTSTAYSVSVTDSKGCSASATTNVTVNPAQSTPVITPSGTTTFCQGNDVTLSCSAGNSYSWSNGATTQDITVTSSGNYSVTVTNASGCSATSSSVNVLVLSFNASITPSGSTSIC